MLEFNDKSREGIIAECQRQLRGILDLACQKRTLNRDADLQTKGVFGETGLYPNEFIALRDSVFTLFQTLGADETEGIVDKILLEYQDRLPETFVVNFSRLVRLTANKIRVEKAENN